MQLLRTKQAARWVTPLQCWNPVRVRAFQLAGALRPGAFAWCLYKGRDAADPRGRPGQAEPTPSDPAQLSCCGPGPGVADLPRPVPPPTRRAPTAHPDLTCRKASLLFCLLNVKPRSCHRAFPRPVQGSGPRGLGQAVEEAGAEPGPPGTGFDHSAQIPQGTPKRSGNKTAAQRPDLALKLKILQL